MVYLNLQGICNCAENFESFLVVLAMVNTCCIPGCKTGYKSHKNHPKTALFQFPSKKVLKNK